LVEYALKLLRKSK